MTAREPAGRASRPSRGAARRADGRTGVLVVGAGLAAQRCCEALRARGFDGPIRLLGDELHAPYDRPPLSKELLTGATERVRLSLRPRTWYADHEVDLMLGARAVALDARARTVTLAGGGSVRYGRVVIATGGVPRPLAGLALGANVHTLRTIDDALALRAALGQGVRLVVVGAGLIGLEVAAAATKLGASITVIEAAPAPMASVLGARAGRWLAEWHASHGVAVVTGAAVVAVRGRGRVEELELADGRRVPCDAVLVAVGMQPATGWLASSGMAAGAVSTDSAGRTPLAGVFAAGDAAGAGHWERAARQGAAVAASILGAPAPVAAPPSFWSDQHGMRLQFAGTAAGHDALAVDGDPAAGDGRVVYLRDGRPVGGLLMGRPRDLPGLRRLLSDARNGVEMSAA